MAGKEREVIIHPYLNEKVEIGLLPYVQAMLMARYIRQDIDDYPVFLINDFNYVHSCDLRCGYYKQRGGSPFTMCGQGLSGLWTEGAELSL